MLQYGTRISRFVNFRGVKGWGAKLGIEEKGYAILEYALGGTGSGDAGEFSVEGLTGVGG